MEYKRCSSCIPGLGALTGYYQPGQLSPDTKFNYSISQLEPKYIENIWDIINSKIDNKYSDCKSRLLELFRESEGLRIKKLISGIELGDMKPNQLLQKLRSLATPDISDNLIKNFMAR
ncbi:hypothetical protein LAZ67_3005328 [Cordylochernes scorpioides]|uniref:DUF7041 domain-containing protein n=1 Tax=Cordylochernes scorpioides TaxID=51811 RepID=A0ABY6KB29_9ARAC|nr:hypothetical protein LAZ67_3005328 [Cordylochernes scorpioides]